MREGGGRVGPRGQQANKGIIIIIIRRIRRIIKIKEAK